jgi:hypothetical protein
MIPFVPLDGASAKGGSFVGKLLSAAGITYRTPSHAESVELVSFARDRTLSGKSGSLNEQV